MKGSTGSSHHVNLQLRCVVSATKKSLRTLHDTSFFSTIIKSKNGIIFWLRENLLFQHMVNFLILAEEDYSVVLKMFIGMTHPEVTPY